MGANEKQVGGAHYQKPIQHWDFIIANGIPYLEAVAIKYIVRHKEKNGREDLEKAIHYLEKLLETSYPKKLVPPHLCGGVGCEECDGKHGAECSCKVPEPAPCARPHVDENADIVLCAHEAEGVLQDTEEVALSGWLFCPRCKKQHVDEGVWATKPHHVHLCGYCEFKWYPHVFGVAGVPSKTTDVVPSGIAPVVATSQEQCRACGGAGFTSEPVTCTACKGSAKDLRFCLCGEVSGLAPGRAQVVDGISHERHGCIPL